MNQALILEHIAGAGIVVLAERPLWVGSGHSRRAAFAP